MKWTLLFLFCLWAGSLLAQTNMLPDASFENGSITGNQDDYYRFDGKVLWRAWPFIGFEVDTEAKRTGERALRVAFRDYGSGDPTFRIEHYPQLSAGKYEFVFYYKTDVDRAGQAIDIDIQNGKQGDSQSISKQRVTLASEAKDNFVKLLVEFEVDDSFTTFFPYIRVPYIRDGGYLTIDDVSLTKLSTEPNASTPSPTQGQTEVNSQGLRLQWLGGANAVKRNVYFGRSANALEPIATEINETTYLLDALENETEYLWRVDEIDASGTVTTGELWSFTTKSYYDEFMGLIQTGRVESARHVTWQQIGPGNAGFSNFVRYHPLLPDFCVESPDMGNTYQTENNGTSWSTIKDIDGRADFFRLYDLQYSTKTAKYAVAIECSRLYFSQDTARSWTEVKNCPWYTNQKSDGSEGRSWYRKISAVAMDPNDDNTWYVGAGNFCRGQQQLWSTVGTPTSANPRGSENTYDNVKYQGKIWKTSDAGKTWTTLSKGINEKAQFSRIIVHPENSDMLFAGSQYGLFKSIDGGANWTDIGAGKLDNNTIMNMDYYYNASSKRFVLYVADQVRYYPDGQSTRCDGGIFKSEDNGETWTNINGNLGLDLNRLTGGVSSNYYKYIAKWFGISETEAKSTYPNLPTAALQYFNSLSVDPSEPDGLYVGFYDAQIQKSIMPGRLWKTTNGGQSWISVARDFAPAWEADKAYWEERGNPISDNMEEGHQISNQQWGQQYPQRSLRYATVNTRGDVMLIYAHNTFLSTDKGQTFKQVNETYTKNGNIMGTGDSNLPGQCLYQDKRLGAGILYLGSGEHHLWRTSTDGENNKQAMTYLNNSQESVFAVATHPWDEKTVYTTSMRQKDLDRIFKSTDAASTFVDWGKATEATEWMWTNNIRIDPVNPDNMYFGVTQTSGSGGGGGTDGPDKDKEGGFHKSVNAGKSFAPSNSGMPDNVWVQDIEFDPRDETRAALFAAAPWNQEKQLNGGLFHSTNRGETWTAIPVKEGLEGINSVTFDHTGRLYVTAGRREGALDNGGVFVSDDYGQSWEQIFESQFIEHFDVSPFDNHVLVLTQGVVTANPGVFVSFDRGKTWSKNNYSMGQPNNIKQIEFDIHQANTLWLAVMGSGFYKGTIADGTELRKIKLTPGVGQIKANEDLQLMVEAPELTGKLVYKSMNNAVATVAENGVVTGKKDGAVKIWVTSEDGRYADFVYLVVAGVAENKPTNVTELSDAAIQVYPNPASNTLFVKSKQAYKFQIKVYSPSGLLVHKANQRTNQAIDISSFANGIYLYRIESEKGMKTGKFVKQ